MLNIRVSLETLQSTGKSGCQQELGGCTHRVQPDVPSEQDVLSLDAAKMSLGVAHWKSKDNKNDRNAS